MTWQLFCNHIKVNNTWRKRKLAGDMGESIKRQDTGVNYPSFGGKCHTTWFI
jgi:hypothetical protein